MTDEVQQVDIQTYTDDSYLEYAMYVILDRALPHIGDGLKPVHRRIIHAMDQLGLDHKSKYKKSARTIGDVLGKYHPHGDAACYEAMVMLAQPFSTRYPLIDGQGNWGSPEDPKSFAAMRYTESRLAPHARLLLDEMPYNPVNEVKNFDGTLTEPEVLPAQLPFLLLNGTSGIAVGMASNIPPHNITEVIDALIQMINKPKSGLDDILSYIKGPDLPTPGRVITSDSEIRSIYKDGKGSVTMRCDYEIQDNYIIVKALPYKVSGEKVIETIGDLVTNKKKLPVIEDIRDESDEKNPCRIVIKLKKSAASQAEKVMSALLAKTKLETKVHFNFNAIGLDGSPQVMGLVEFLREWLDFRSKTVRQRTSNQLSKVEHQKHITEGLLTAFLNLDEVIRIIREEDKPKEVLMDSFSLSEIQANAILDTRLRKLAKLEEMELKNRHEELEKEQARLTDILSSEDNVRKLIRKELKSIRKDWSDDRVSPIVDESEVVVDSSVSDDVMIPSEPVRVVLSSNGYIRGGKGHNVDPYSLSYKNGDYFILLCDTQTTSDLSLLDSNGRVYCVPSKELPSARSYGDPLSKWITPSGGLWQGMIDPKQGSRWLVSDRSGVAFLAPPEAFSTRNKKGKVLMTHSTKPFSPVVSDHCDSLAVVTSQGRFIVISLDEIPVRDKGKGVRVCNLAKGEVVDSMTPFNLSGGVGIYDHSNPDNPVLHQISSEVVSGYKGQRTHAPKTLHGFKSKAGHLSFFQSKNQ